MQATFPVLELVAFWEAKSHQILLLSVVEDPRGVEGVHHGPLLEVEPEEGDDLEPGVRLLPQGVICGQGCHRFFFLHRYRPL